MIEDGEIPNEAASSETENNKVNVDDTPPASEQPEEQPSDDKGISDDDITEPENNFLNEEGKSDSSEEYSIRWSQCSPALPTQEIDWSYQGTPESSMLDYIQCKLAEPGFHVAADLHEIEIEQLMHWIPQHCSEYDRDSVWYLNGRPEMETISAIATFQDTLSRLEDEKNARYLFDPDLEQSNTRTFIIVELTGARLILGSHQNGEIVRRLSDMGVTLLVLLSDGQHASGSTKNMTLWEHDFQIVWWRFFVAQILLDEEIPSLDKAWTSCMEITEELRLSIETELENPRRKRNLRDLLVDGSEPFLHLDSVEAITEIVRTFKDQNEDERRLRKELLAKIFPNQTDYEIGPLDLNSAKVMPLEPHATAIFVIWASLQGSELDTLRLDWFRAAFDFQLHQMSVREAEIRSALRADSTLGKKKLKTKLKKLATVAHDFRALDDLRQRMQLENLFGQLKIRRRSNRERGELLAFSYVNSIEVIGDFLRMEASEYLSAQIDMYLSGWATLFDPNENVAKIARRLAVRRFRLSGSLSDSVIRASIANELTAAFLTRSIDMIHNYHSKRAASIASATKFADFITYWFESDMSVKDSENSSERESVRELFSDIAIRVIQLNRDLVEYRDLMFVRLLDRITYANENVVDIRKLIRTIGNSAPSSLQSVVLDFFDQLGGLYDSEDVDSKEVLKPTVGRQKGIASRRRASRLQFQLFEVLEQELNEHQYDRDDAPYTKFLAALSTRVLANCLIRANEMDYRETSTPSSSSDRMLSRIFEEPEGVERFAKILLSNPVRNYSDNLYADLSRTSNYEKVEFQVNELRQLSIQQSFSGLKVDSQEFGDEVDAVAEEKSKIRQQFRERRLGIEQVEILLNEETVSTLRSHSFRLLLELHGLLVCSSRGELLSRLLQFLTANLETKTDKAPFYDAKELHRQYLLSLCDLVRKSHVNGNLSNEERRFALDALLKRINANKTLSFRAITTSRE